MTIRLFDITSLDDELVARWDAIQRGNPMLDNPFLRPEFTQAVAAVRDDVEIAVLEDDGQVRGFFPFQRGHYNVGTPVGGHLSNYQAFIVDQAADWDAREFVAACELSAWNFDNLVVSQTAFGKHHHFVEGCGYLDLSQGYDAYVAMRRASGSKNFKEIFRKQRKLEREVGPLRFELHTDDHSVLQQLLDWKTTQCEQARTFNLFAFYWSVGLLAYILEHPTDKFEGLLSVLYAGDEPAAIMYDLVSESAADGWLIAFDPRFAKFSPGLVCALQKAKALAERGVMRFYAGRGRGQHKATLSSDSLLLAEGAVDCSPIRNACRRGWTATREWLRSSPFRHPARQVKRFLEPFESRRLAAVKTTATGNEIPTSEKKTP